MIQSTAACTKAAERQNHELKYEHGKGKPTWNREMKVQMSGVICFAHMAS